VPGGLPLSSERDREIESLRRTVLKLAESERRLRTAAMAAESRQEAALEVVKAELVAELGAVHQRLVEKNRMLVAERARRNVLERRLSVRVADRLERLPLLRRRAAKRREASTALAARIRKQARQ
jgi:hypothetical protein